MDSFHFPPDHIKILQTFESQVSALEQSCAENFAADATTEILTQGQSLQSYFVSHIKELSVDPLPQEQRSRFQSALTEMHRLLRLLQTDLLFLRSARQSATAAARQKQLCDRLHSLRGYCTVLLQAP